MNAHFALTAADQVVCLALVNLAGAKSKKGEANMWTLTEDNMIDNVKLDKDFNFTFGKYLDSYSTNENYGSQMGLTRDNVTKFIELYAFSGGNSNINIEKQAYNFLMYIMLKNRIQLAESAFQMAVYAGKSSVSDKGILLSTKVMFTGALGKSMHKKIEDVSNRVRRLEKEKKGSEDSESKEKDAGDKKSSKKKEEKKSKKDEKSDEELDEESEESENEKSEEESEEESDSE